MEDCGDACVGWTTCASMEDAEGLAELLLKENICACVNITSGVTSMYWWDGKVNKDVEYLLMIKTGRDMKDKVVHLIKKHHSYDVPEVIFVNVVGGNEDYLSWIRESLQTFPK